MPPILKEGQKAPPFELPASDGTVVALADFAGTGKSVVLYFYPRDLTPGCTVEARDFRDAAGRFARKKAVVLGVSRDSIASHCKFVAKEQLSFRLLSDPEAKVIQAYGAWGEKTLYGKKSLGILRSTVVIGPDGKIAKVFPKVKVAGHVEDVLAAIPR